MYPPTHPSPLVLFTACFVHRRPPRFLCFVWCVVFFIFFFVLQAVATRPHRGRLVARGQRKEVSQRCQGDLGPSEGDVARSASTKVCCGVVLVVDCRCSILIFLAFRPLLFICVCVPSQVMQFLFLWDRPASCCDEALCCRHAVCV